LGWVLGYPAAWALALSGGGSPPPLSARTTLLSLSAAALVMLGALIVATAAERTALRTPVVGLLRRVPSRRAGWRADLVDVLIAALAVVGIYQAWADRDAVTGTRWRC
jgi:hypothetical protein